MREVYITMGLPCCGKTKYCYNHADSITNVYTSNSCYNANWGETFYIDSDVQTNDELNKVFLNLLDRNNIKINIIYFKENKQQSIQNLKYKYFSGSNESIRKEKDINKYIKSSLHYPSIIETGINRYLDYFINDETLHIDIAKQGRKCDLDILIHDKNESVRKAVARHGYDDHLDILAKENNPNINKIINELRGKREL